MKTIKELADSIKVSKVSIYKAIKREDISAHIIKHDNTTLVDEVGEQLLINLFNRSKPDSKEFKEDKSDIVGILEKQLNEKDAYIKELLEIISNQQKLQATQMITDGKTKVSLWDKIFKRKDNQD